VTTATSTAAVPKSAASVNSSTMTKKPTGATVVKPDASVDNDEEAASPAPTAKPAAAKKKPAAASKPAATTSEPAEEKRREPRPQKVNLNSYFFS
jgi:hypothetical protein